MSRSRKGPKTGRSDTPIKGVTITVRGPFQFQVRFRKTGHPSKTETFETRAKAEAWGIEQVNKANRGEATPNVKRQAQPTLGEVIDRYIEMAAPTLKGEVQAVSQARQLLKTDLAKFAIGNVRSSDVIDWLVERRAAKVRRLARDDQGRVVTHRRGRRVQKCYVDVQIAEKTVLNELIRLSAIFEFARVELNMKWLKNPVDDVPCSRKPKYKPRSRRFGDDEWGPVITACRESRCAVLAPIVELALETACRRSELVKLLQWEEIDLARAVAKFEDTKSSTGEYRERIIGLSERAIEILRELGPKKRGRVFNVRPDNITRNFRKACEKAGVADLTLHDHRGEAASRMAQDMGVDIVELATQGGWKDLKTLAKYYQPSPEKIAKKLTKRARSA